MPLSGEGPSAVFGRHCRALRRLASRRGESCPTAVSAVSNQAASGSHAFAGRRLRRSAGGDRGGIQPADHRFLNLHRNPLPQELDLDQEAQVVLPADDLPLQEEAPSRSPGPAGRAAGRREAAPGSAPARHSRPGSSPAPPGAPRHRRARTRTPGKGACGSGASCRGSPTAARAGAGKRRRACSGTGGPGISRPAACCAGPTKVFLPRCSGGCSKGRPGTRRFPGARSASSLILSAKPRRADPLELAGGSREPGSFLGMGKREPKSRSHTASAHAERRAADCNSAIRSEGYATGEPHIQTIVRDSSPSRKTAPPFRVREQFRERDQRPFCGGARL
jgi:hypothetical protein